MIHVYVAAPYRLAPNVRAAHRQLEGFGLRWTSHWAELADGPDRAGELPATTREELRAQNHDGVAAADAMIVFGEANMCETLVEVGVAIADVCTRVVDLTSAIEAILAREELEAA